MAYVFVLALLTQASCWLLESRRLLFDLVPEGLLCRSDYFIWLKARKKYKKSICCTVNYLSSETPQLRIAIVL